MSDIKKIAVVADVASWLRNATARAFAAYSYVMVTTPRTIQVLTGPNFAIGNYRCKYAARSFRFAASPYRLDDHLSNGCRRDRMP